MCIHWKRISVPSLNHLQKLVQKQVLLRHYLQSSTWLRYGIRVLHDIIVPAGGGVFQASDPRAPNLLR